MACQHCGDCCRYVALRVEPETVPWLELHGVPVIAHDGGYSVQVDLPCRWYDEAAQRCTHYDERPPICRAFLCEKARGTA